MPLRFTHFYPDGDGTGGSSDGDAGGTGGSGSGTQTATKEPPEGNGSTQAGGDADGENTELARARREAAKYRTERNDLQTKLKEIEDKDKSTAEKAQGEVTELNDKITAQDQRIRDLSVAAVAGDVGIVKEARADAAKLLDWSTVEDPSNLAQVEKALKNLVKEKPFLAAKTSGGADGGAGGRGSSDSLDMNAAIRRGAGR